MTRDDWFAGRWASAGVGKGDMLLLHSSLKRTILSLRRAGFSASVEDVLNSFLDVLGPEGTLILPIFNFSFTTGTPFDIRTTPSEMGALTEIGRKHPDAVRTGHPIYSFVAIGAKSAMFRGIDNYSGYGGDSPFSKLMSEDAKIGVLDLEDFDSMTFYHYVEEALEVDYRLPKMFSGDYTDAEGNTASRSYGIFVRNLDMGVQTDVNPMGERLWAKGLYSGHRPGEESGLRTIRARDLYDETKLVIESGLALGLLYSTDK